jgi:hypothetical protein
MRRLILGSLLLLFATGAHASPSEKRLFVEGQSCPKGFSDAVDLSPHDVAVMKQMSWHICQPVIGALRFTGDWETAVQVRPVIRIPLLAQTSASCGTGVAHCTTLTWIASATQGVTYSVFRGTTSGGESATPLNSSPITALTYIDPVTLTSSPQTFFYFVEAVETSGTITANSLPSLEVSATFPGIPASPGTPSATPH